MNTKMKWDSPFARMNMILPSFYADLFSASAQMTIKSILPILFVSIGIKSYSFDLVLF